MHILRNASLIALILGAVSARASTTIDFTALALNTTLSTQFSGIAFSGTALAGKSSTGYYLPTGYEDGTFATSTDLTVVDSYVGGGSNWYDQFGASGGKHILHSYDGWAGEDGDTAIVMTFASAINSMSVNFVGDYDGDSTLVAFSGAGATGTVLGIGHVDGGAGEDDNALDIDTASVSAANIKSVAVLAGSYDDWVGVDTITYNTQPVPEPASLAALGLGLLAALRRRRRA